MGRKPKAFMTIETKEDFEKHFNDIYYAGYESGFEDGRINALGIINDALNKNFSAEEHSTANWQVRQNKIRKWQKEEEERKRKEDEEIQEIFDFVERSAEAETIKKF